MDIKFHGVQYSDGVAVFDFSVYEEFNRAQAKKIFESEELPDIEVVNDVPEMNYRFVYDEHAIRMKLFMKDLKDTESSLYALCSSIEGESVLEKKLNIFNKALPKLICRWQDPGYGPHAEHRKKIVVHYGNKGYYFNYYLPEEKFLDYGTDIEEIPLDDLLDFVVPQFYYDLGMFDRERLRADEDEMDYLRKHWFESCVPELD